MRSGEVLRLQIDIEVLNPPDFGPIFLGYGIGVKFEFTVLPELEALILKRSHGGESINGVGVGRGSLNSTGFNSITFKTN